MNDGSRLADKAEWMGRLLEAFGGDASGWEWTGEVREQDPAAVGAVHCACGQHGLRYLFPWRKPGQAAEVITGSVCVHEVPGLSPAELARLQGAVEARAVAARQAKAEARKADKEARVAALAEEIRRQLRRVIELDARYHRGEKLSQRQINLAFGHRHFHQCLVEGLRLKSPSGKLGRLLPVRERLAVRLAESDADDAAVTAHSAA